MNLFKLSGHLKLVICRVLNWSDIIFLNAAVITAAVITTHNVSRDLCRSDCCSDHCRVFLTRQMTYFQCPDNNNKFILFWEKYRGFSVPSISTYLSYLVTHFINNTSKIQNLDYS